MPTPDFFSLGGMTFDGFSTPADLPFGGKQQMHVKKLPGGARVIDTMGPDDDDRTWHGTFYGADALNNALTLDAMRQAGAPVAYTSAVESRTVVISDFAATVERFNVIHYTLTLVMADTGANAGLPTSLDSLVGSDLSAALGML